MVNARKSREPARRSHIARLWPTLVLGGVILLSGAGLGAGGLMLLGQRSEPAPSPSQPPSEAASRLAARIASRRGLDDQQTEQVQDAIERHLGEIRAVRRDLTDRVETIHNGLRDDMKAILTPEQFEEWDAEFERIRERVRQFRRDRDPDAPRRRTRRAPDRNRLLVRMLLRFDQEGDGTLTEDEVPAVLWHGLSSADTDGDGVVTREELEAAFQVDPPDEESDDEEQDER